MAHEAPETLAASETKQANLSAFGTTGTLIGVLGFVGYWAFYAASPAAQPLMAKAYMYGWMFWMATTLGCLGLTLLHHTVRGSWALSVLRLLEAGGGVASLVTMFIAYIPILVVQDKVYPWTHPGTDPVLLQKQALYNPVAFDIRTVVLFLIWIGLAAYLRKSSVDQDTSKDQNLAQKRTNLAAPGMVIFALTATLASTDWVMSMDPHWYSTMFGPIIIICGCLTALSFSVLVLLFNRSKEPFAGSIKPDHTKDLGNMLLTITLLWAYFNFSQFVIIWNGNLPATASYYAKRSPYGFNILGGILILLCFAVPFLALITPRIKKYPHLLMRVAALIFVMRFLDMYYIVAPMYSTTMLPGWEILSLLGVGGLWFAAFGAAVKKANLYPIHDMRLLEATHHA